MYYGEAQAAVDDKGRLNVPTHLRNQMKALNHELWFMTRGFDGAIFLFNHPTWEQLLKQGSGSMLDPRLLDFRRLFLGGSSSQKVDNQGRLPIPAHLRAYAGIDREAVIIGVEDHLELWSVSGWQQFQERQAQEYKRMAAELFGARTPGHAQPTDGE